MIGEYVQAGSLIREGISAYASDVRDGIFPAAEKCYQMPEAELEDMLADPGWKDIQNEG